MYFWLNNEENISKFPFNKEIIMKWIGLFKRKYGWWRKCNE